MVSKIKLFRVDVDWDGIEHTHHFDAAEKEILKEFDTWRKTENPTILNIDFGWARTYVTSLRYYHCYLEVLYEEQEGSTVDKQHRALVEKPQEKTHDVVVPEIEEELRIKQKLKEIREELRIKQELKKEGGITQKIGFWISGFVGMFAFIMLVRAVVKQEDPLVVVLWWAIFLLCLVFFADELRKKVEWKRVKYLFTTDAKLEDELNIGIIPEGLENKFKIEGLSLSENATVRKEGDKWVITDEERERKYIIKKGGGKLDIYQVKF